MDLLQKGTGLPDEPARLMMRRQDNIGSNLSFPPLGKHESWENRQIGEIEIPQQKVSNKNWVRNKLATLPETNVAPENRPPP